MTEVNANATQMLKSEYDSLYKLLQMRADIDCKIMLAMSSVNQVVGSIMSVPAQPAQPTTQSGQVEERVQEVPAQNPEPVQEQAPEPTPEPVVEPKEVDPTVLRKQVVSLMTSAPAEKKAACSAVMNGIKNPQSLTAEQLQGVIDQMEAIING